MLQPHAHVVPDAVLVVEDAADHLDTLLGLFPLLFLHLARPLLLALLTAARVQNDAHIVDDLLEELLDGLEVMHPLRHLELLLHLTHLKMMHLSELLILPI